MELVIDINNLAIVFLTIGIAFTLTVLMAPGFIPMLHRFKFGQEVREEGPQSHLKKQGTPTMGGIMFLISGAAAAVMGFIAFGQAGNDALQVLFLMIGFGAVGFADDFLKIKKHNTDGLKPKQKLILQLVIALIFSVWAFYSVEEGHSQGRVYIPFTGNHDTALYIDLPVWLFVPFVILVILGTDNGVNFTDGLDGLNGSVTAVVAGFFMMLGLANKTPGLSIVAAGILGGLLGYLLFNVFPAKVFMGDTGSLALGGFVAAAGVVSGMELYIPIFGFIYMIEVISVIIQVTYFKKTHGKRFFKMAPIHHHFELLGNSETRIVAAFTIVTMLLSAVSFLGAVYIR